ncbi:MAG: family 78 glycoside hydrolase catalytic domain [Clostridia bacterium]|nr:family 78 glycoside hydrolase catalytic domain [Clostridia bacterium]
MFSTEAKWIGLKEDDRYKTQIQSPALQLRKVFTYVGEGKAECLICGLGLYLLYINGQKVGDDVLSPAFTAYDMRSLFVRYDISKYLKKGENIIAIKLGNGYFNQTTEDMWHYYHATWRNEPRVRFEIFQNGKSVFVSDTSWKATYNGATVHNAIREGEYYDARKADAWLEFAYDDSEWQQARIVRSPGGELYEQTMPLIREHDVFSPVAVWKSENGWTYDFGKNIAGYIGISMRGKRGETAVFRYAEKLNGKEIDQSNIDFYINTKNYQQDRYTFKGEGVENWKPDFVYHGFQYVEVSGIDIPPTIDEIKAYHVYTDLHRKGNFRSSDELLNWIYEAGIRTFLNNYHGFPEDCPHREKCGWTGDAMNSSGYAVFNFDMRQAYYKWLIDLCDTQRKNGQICSIAPTAGKEYNWGSGPSFDLALFVIPYVLYLETGETRCINYVYPYAKKYLQYAQEFEEDGTVCFGLADWRPPDNIQDLNIMSNRFSDSCYYYAMFAITSRMAALQGLTEETKNYLKKANDVKQAILNKYVDGDNVDNNGQGALATALYYHIVEGEQAKAVAKKLASLLEREGYKYKVGILGIKALLNALSEYGYTDVAYKTVARYDYPSYGYWRTLGATTLWESWLGDASRNHHMFGDVLNWLVRNVAGLQNDGLAYDSCILKPYFFAQDCSASAETQTPNGKISFAWQKTGNTFTAFMEIPAGVQAKLVLDGKEPIACESGKYQITLESL